MALGDAWLVMRPLLTSTLSHIGAPRMQTL